MENGQIHFRIKTLALRPCNYYYYFIYYNRAICVLGAHKIVASEHIFHACAHILTPPGRTGKKGRRIKKKSVSALPNTSSQQVMFGTQERAECRVITAQMQNVAAKLFKIKKKRGNRKRHHKLE